jgi:hypothetical protein
MRAKLCQRLDVFVADTVTEAARCSCSSPWWSDPVTGAGVAFVRLESDPDPVRVRAGWVSDADIREMAADCAGDLRPVKAVAA